MKTVHFVYRGKFAHFLRAEANASAPSYPVPPRTVLLGLTGAVLGLEKDSPQQVLGEACYAVAGKIPQTHWHSANLRKEPPAPLDYVVKATSKGSGGSDEKNTIIAQQWLLNPCYDVWAALPEPFHGEFVQRLRDRAWYFCPCLGLSAMIADLEYQDEDEAEQMPRGVYAIAGVLREVAGTVDIAQAAREQMHLKLLRLPRAVSEERVFSHASYWLEKENRQVPFETDKAWKLQDRYLLFL